MIIERARRSDVPALTSMLRRFHDACALPWDYDAVAMSLFLAGAVERDLCLVQRDPSPSGVMVASRSRLPWGGPEIAVERLWWVDQGHRSVRSARGFLAGFERWADDCGIRHLHMAQALGDDRLADLYRRRGYERRETHFMKSL